MLAPVIHRALSEAGNAITSAMSAAAREQDDEGFGQDPWGSNARLLEQSPMPITGPRER
jgi:hypothetical protein